MNSNSAHNVESAANELVNTISKAFQETQKKRLFGEYARVNFDDNA